MVDVTSGDWRQDKSLVDSCKYMFENQLFTDVTFKVGEEQEEIKSNRLILSLRSAFFDRMLNGDFRESRQDPVIKDVDPETFKAVLRYCYYDETEVENEVAFTTMCAAKQYLLPKLENTCRKAVSKNLVKSNILQLYKYSISTDDHELKDCCHEYISHNLDVSFVWDIYSYALLSQDETVLQECRKFFKSRVDTTRWATQEKAFLDIRKDVLLDFLHINDVFDETEKEYYNAISTKGSAIRKYEAHFGIKLSEIELFRACKSWAEAECQRQNLQSSGVNMRTMLDKCLFLIRFSTMLPEDLCCIVYPTGILSEDELNLVFQYRFEKNQANGLGPDLFPFPLAQRNLMFSIGNLTNEPMCVKFKERVMVTRIWFTQKGKYSVTIKDTECGTLHGIQEVNKRSEFHIWHDDDYFHLNYIDLEPTILQAGKEYTVKIINHGKETSEKADPLQRIDSTCMPFFPEIQKMTTMKEWWCYAFTGSLV